LVGHSLFLSISKVIDPQNHHEWQAFKAEFDGSGTVFAPAVAPGEEEGEEKEGGGNRGGRRRVLKYGEGLAHRLVLLEEE
jgi:hypothetical protein